MFRVLNEISSHLNVSLLAAFRTPQGGSNEYYDEAEDKSSMSSHVFANASLFSVPTA